MSISEPSKNISKALDILTKTAAESIVVTVPMSDAIHSRVLAICERRGVDIATVIEDLMHRYFPPQLVATPGLEEIVEIAASGKPKKISWQMRLIFRQRRSR